MSAQSMLEQLLKSGLSMLDPNALDPNASGSNAPGSNASRSEAARPGAPVQGWGQFGAGTAVGGALGLLLGSKRGRKMGGKALKYGSVAALGAMAYQGYRSWQAQQGRLGSAEPGGASVQPGLEMDPNVSTAPRTLDLLPAPEVELHSRAVLQAMIAASKSDGHLDERERGLLDAELSRLETDPAQRAWFEAELRRPLDPAEVARAATSPELASEMYLASLLVTDETSFMERAYLDELARQLRLPDGLKSALQKQVLAT